MVRHNIATTLYLPNLKALTLEFASVGEFIVLFNIVYCCHSRLVGHPPGLAAAAVVVDDDGDGSFNLGW